MPHLIFVGESVDGSPNHAGKPLRSDKSRRRRNLDIVPVFLQVYFALPVDLHNFGRSLQQRIVSAPGLIQYARDHANAALDADLLGQLIRNTDLIGAAPTKGMTEVQKPPLTRTEEAALRGCDALIDVKGNGRIDLAIEIVDRLDGRIDTVCLIRLQRGNVHVGEGEFLRFKDKDLFLHPAAFNAVHARRPRLIDGRHRLPLPGFKKHDAALTRLTEEIQLFFAAVVREFHDDGSKHRPDV